jgi:hypothetical protein
MGSESVKRMNNWKGHTNGIADIGVYTTFVTLSLRLKLGKFVTFDSPEDFWQGFVNSKLLGKAHHFRIMRESYDKPSFLLPTTI